MSKKIKIKKTYLSSISGSNIFHHTTFSNKRVIARYYSIKDDQLYVCVELNRRKNRFYEIKKSNEELNYVKKLMRINSKPSITTYMFKCPNCNRMHSVRGKIMTPCQYCGEKINNNKYTMRGKN